MTDRRRSMLLTRRDRALDDLIDLERQVQAGEIDDDAAHRLRERYEAEAADVLEALDGLQEESTASGRSTRRVLIGIGGFAAVALAVTIALLSAVEPRPEGGFVTGGVAADVLADDGTIDLAAVSNEQMETVVAQNPDVLPMRLALARRYVEDGDFSAALDHYLYVLERQENPEALMYVGWMTYVSGDPETGVTLLERSLALAPGEPLAQWFLANALLYGLNDPEGAIPLLESVIGSGIAPPDVVTAAERMLVEARS